jgi:TonB family protein
MSNIKLISALTALGCLTTGAQTVADGPGVTVDLGGAEVMHRAPVNYPVGARGTRAEGTVTMELALDSAGSVADARVLSGPLELRKSSILSVMQWHFAKDAASTTRQVRITYQAPANAPAMPGRVAIAPMPGPSPLDGKKVEHINIIGLPAEARADLLSRLPVHEGDAYSSDLGIKTLTTVRQFDEHLSYGFRDSNGSLTLQISTPGAYIEPPSDPKRITIGGNVQQAKLISQPRPVYPADAKAARVQGTVTLEALIGADGHVANLTVLSGDAMLVPSAMQAVSQWVYQQTLLNGVPVEVKTQIDVNYTLAQ